MKYHINFEGKIYPCNAKVMKCPYGESLHSTSKVALYYKLMGQYGADIEPSENAVNELEKTDRLKSLYSLSPDIEKIEYPADLIVSTLKESISHMSRKGYSPDSDKYKQLEIDAAEDVCYALHSGMKLSEIPSFIPERVKNRGYKRFIDKYEGIPARLHDADKRYYIEQSQIKLVKRKNDLKGYDEFNSTGLSEDTHQKTLAWMTRDFEKFAHDLNTSKMITQPIFYGDLEKAKETIKQMDNYELLSTFDDYSVTDKEIHHNVKEANYFEYEDRKDLSDEANKKLRQWYNRNRQIYDNWKINTPKRVLLSMEIARELDRRTVLRQDSVIDEMLSKDGEKLI